MGEMDRDIQPIPIKAEQLSLDRAKIGDDDKHFAPWVQQLEGHAESLSRRGQVLERVVKVMAEKVSAGHGGFDRSATTMSSPNFLPSAAARSDSSTPRTSHPRDLNSRSFCPAPHPT